MRLPTIIGNVFVCYSLPVLLIGLVHVSQNKFSRYQIINERYHVHIVDIHNRSHGSAVTIKINFLNLGRKDNSGLKIKTAHVTTTSLNQSITYALGNITFKKCRITQQLCCFLLIYVSP